MSTFFSKPFNLDSTVRLTIFILATFAILLLFKYLSPVLLPFFIAWLIAYIVHPLVVFSQKNLGISNRTLAVIFVLCSSLLVIMAGNYFIFPMLIDQFLKLKDFIIEYVNNTNITTVHSWEPILRKFLIDNHIVELFMQENLSDLFSFLFPFAQSILDKSVAITGALATFFFSILYLFFILKDYQVINDHFIALIPMKYKDKVSLIMQDLEMGMSNYYRGQFIVVLVVGTLYALGFYIIGMPIGILMGIIVGILNFVPYLQIVAIPPCILLMLVHSLETGTSTIYSLIFLLIVFVVVQVIQDGFLVPKIMGKKMGLNAAVILLSLSIFGMLFGVIGLIIALPITTLMISYYKRYILTKVNHRYQREKEGESPETIEQLRQ